MELILYKVVESGQTNKNCVRLKEKKNHLPFSTPKQLPEKGIIP